MVDLKRFGRLAGIVAAAVCTAACTNMPPVLSPQPNGAFRVSLPLGSMLANTLLFSEDARIPLAGGQVVVLEHDNFKGTARFLFPGGSYVAMDALRHARVVQSMVMSGGQTMALVQGDLGEQRDVELSIIIQGHRLSWVALGDPGQTWAMQQASDGSPRVVFEQQGAADPRIRIFDPRTLRISPPYLRSALLQAQTRRPSTETQPPRPRLAQRLVPVSPELVDASAGLRSPGRRVPNRATSGTAGVQADIIVLNGATQGVQSAVAAGHQSVAPQEVNLQ